MEISLPWGEKTLDFDLPENWDVQVLQSQTVPPVITDMDKIMRENLDKPINSESLSEIIKNIKPINEKGKIVIIIDDKTRPTPIHRMMGPLINYIEETGFPLKDVSLYTALGTHIPMTEKEIRERVTDEVYDKIKCYNHIYTDNESLKFIGYIHGNMHVSINKKVAEADLVITLSTIEVHGQAGFGGGLKNIIPGVSSLETIEVTHTAKLISIKKMSEAGVTKNYNKMRQLIDETALKATKRVFLVNTLLNVDKPYRLICGEPLEAHKKGAEEVSTLFGHEIKEKADLVITNSAPFDIDAYVGTKCTSNALNFVKKGGIIVTFMLAKEGKGIFKDNPISKLQGFLLRKLPLKIVRSVMDKLSGGYDQAGGAFDFAKMCRYFNPQMYIHNIPEFKALTGMGVTFHTDPHDMMKKVEEMIGKSKIVKNGKPKVIVLPYGGSTYAIPPPN
jgi:lactate racemase